MNNFYALIMAGGGGTRLWPLSRKLRPKQMLSLVDKDSMFRLSVTRLLPLLPAERIFVVTGAAQMDALCDDVPELPRENFIIEPFGRDSGPAAALGVAHIHSLDPDAVIAILTADHYIRDIEGFRNTLCAAYDVALQGYIVTLGIEPSHPATGFGYIQRAEELQISRSLKVYHSAGFKEKPDVQTALSFLESGLYYWNSGMFIWTAAQAMAEFERQQPQIFATLQAIIADFGTPAYPKTIARLWNDMTAISLDYAIMERAERMTVIPVNIGWSDIGSWAALYEELTATTDANVVIGTGQHIKIDTQGTLVHSERTVVTIGLDDLVIVDTPDVLLICKRDRAQDVRQAIQHLKEIDLDRLL